jgi:Ca2+-binding RTX toxin-like protein
MSGGADNDFYFVNDVGDTVTEAAGAGTDTVSTTLISYTLGANIENVTFTGIANFTGVGNALANTINSGIGNDTLTGGAGDDRLNGGAGNDTLNGGLGNDMMAGGTGNDTYFVDSFTDAVVENLNEGVDTVNTTTTSFNLGTNLENLTFIGAGNFSGGGSAADNIITAGAGNDTLNGQAGNDTLIGGAGNDQMTGGVGNDIFQFFADFGADTITDFDSNPAGGQDLLDISGLGALPGDWGCQAAIATCEHRSLAGRNRCPQPEPSVPL